MRTYPITLLALALACGPSEPPTEYTPPAPAETGTTAHDGAGETTGSAEPAPLLDLPPAPAEPPRELCCSCTERTCASVIRGECANADGWRVCDLDSDVACLAACGVCCDCDSLDTPEPYCEPSFARPCSAAIGAAWCQPDPWGTLDDCRAACGA